MEEVWKPIPGFEGIYSASNLGRVRRDKGKTSDGKNWREKILKPRYNRDGYVKYTLYSNGKPHYKVAHRLICETFLGPPPEGKPFALHRDDNPKNNHVDNLYWGSLGDNQRDIIRNGNNFGINKTHCIHGHEYTPENTYRIPKTGSRSCQTCRREYASIYNEKRKLERLKRRNGNSED